jgi:DMSO/TMAO reductase YedYZ molybdopterin-dependent catalytic subunit
MSRTAVHEALRCEVVAAEPYNAQTPTAALEERITPVGAFFVRHHFAEPALNSRTWRLWLSGAVHCPAEMGYADLLAVPLKEITVVVECAGDGRSPMRPIAPGLPWGERAVGCARLAGVPFRDVAARAGIHPEIREVLFVGADSGGPVRRTARVCSAGPGATGRRGGDDPLARAVSREVSRGVTPVAQSASRNCPPSRRRPRAPAPRM